MKIFNILKAIKQMLSNPCSICFFENRDRKDGPCHYCQTFSGMCP